MRFEKGQALVLVLLSLSVVLTLVLFVLSRSVTDIAISSRDEEAVRAFSAAEAGIERALVIGTDLSNPNLGNGAGYSVSVANVSENSSNFIYPASLSSNDSVTLWFSSHDDDGNLICDATHPCFTGSTLKVCWGNPGTNSLAGTTPAIEVSVVYDSNSIARWAIDPNNSGHNNNFSAPDLGDCQIGSEDYEFGKTIALPVGSLKFASARMFYNSDANHKIGFDADFPGNSTLPSQGILASSVGTAGESNRRIEVFQGYPEAPSIFQNAIFSSFGITK